MPKTLNFKTPKIRPLVKLTLCDGRVFEGTLVLDIGDTIDLVWDDKGVNHQVCVPRSLVQTEEQTQV